MMVKLGLLAVLALGAVLGLTMATSTPDPASTAKPSEPTPPGMQELVIGGGCFWCVEAIFEDLKGVTSVESGYAGGSQPNPTYEMVGRGDSGHAEVVKIVFDPKVVSEGDLLRIFFTTHDPTQLNRQGNDYGTQYRSVIFYANETERKLAEKIRQEVIDAKIWPRKIVTTIEPLRNYAKAEDYHQDYFEKFEKGDVVVRSKMNSGYCSAVIEPKVRKFREKYRDKLKKGG
ncbi:MAG TPA: peptide-methionine (S)-S-oxide reductase MsrA [Fimbriimonadaceae bacterium]|nr:peptide-methionine (S)-S-oxide reductase MsrA [Fimbriimonadaceae bacterium]